MKNFDFKTKELIATYTYSTIGDCRNGVQSVNIDGRWYDKYGIYQAVTFVGNIYKIYDSEEHVDKRVLVIGISKQHPCDSKIDKQLAYEVAMEYSLTKPAIIMDVPKYFRKKAFVDLCRIYENNMDLNFIKTRKEILNTNTSASKYNR